MTTEKMWNSLKVTINSRVATIRELNTIHPSQLREGIIKGYMDVLECMKMKEYDRNIKENR